MKTIVRRSVGIVTFVGLLSLSLSIPQLAHVQRFADLLVITPRRKTLAELARQELAGVDASNLADFFRISPWDPDDLRLPLVEFIIAYLQGRVANTSLPIFLSLDDSLSQKDKATHKLESVDWHFDHNRHRNIQAGCHVVLRIHWGDYHFPLLWRLYLRAKTVRRLNRRRQKQNHRLLHYRSKLDLARQMLEQIVPLLPPTTPVYVLFDSWYTAAKLVKWIRQQGWHVIAGLKSNRNVSGKKLTDWHNELKGRRYTKVFLRLADRRQRTYWVRAIQGRIHGVPGDVRVLFSQTGPGAHAPKHFLCTDLALSAQEILSRYQHRWRQEVDYWYVKLQLGLGDFRVQSYEAIEKWYAEVYLVLTYLYWQSYEDQEKLKRTVSLSEVMTRLREEHQREVLRSACTEAANGVPLDEVLERYLGAGSAKAA
jgi:DDE superfamily endonuclease